MSAYDDLSPSERGSLLHMAELTDSSLAEIFGELSRRDAVVAAAAATNGPSGATGDGDQQLLTAAAVGALLGFRKARVYEMRRRGEIGCVRDGRTVRFTKAQVADFISSRSRSVA